MNKRLALFLLVAVAGWMLALALPSSAQTGSSPSASPSVTVSASPSPSASGSSTAKVGPPILGKGNWTKYIAVLIGALGALVLLALGAGYLFQAPGFRRAEGDDSE